MYTVSWHDLALKFRRPHSCLNLYYKYKNNFNGDVVGKAVTHEYIHSILYTTNTRVIASIAGLKQPGEAARSISVIYLLLGQASLKLEN